MNHDGVLYLWDGVRIKVINVTVSENTIERKRTVLIFACNTLKTAHNVLHWCAVVSSPLSNPLRVISKLGFASDLRHPELASDRA